ncbi:transcriptional regulator [Ahrensia marina]|uniref:Transcriptional regulator n=2 Tax=Ahrensia marina TaxID=1514904 RepID=A0A0M9GPB9_9HYPH|nr:transcriptional regulator [Ahrensia marina]
MTMFDIKEIRAQWAKQRPDLNTEPMELIGQLIRVSTHLSGEMAATFSRHGINAASFDVLATLLRSGPPHSLSPNQLLETMMVSSGTMTNRIDQLVKEKLVERIQNPQDKRSVLISLTEKGRRLIDDAVTDHVNTQARLVAPFSDKEFADLNNLLRSYLLKIGNNGEAD